MSDPLGNADQARVRPAGHAAPWRRLVLLLALLCPVVWSNGWEHHAVPVDALLRALHSEHPEYRARAAVSLGIKGERSAVPDLIAVLADNEPAPQVRASVFRALGRIGDPAAVGPLLKALRTEQRPELRAAAALGLGDMADPGSLDTLLEVLSRESDFGVRVSTITALGGFGVDKAVTALAAYTGDPDARIRRGAIRSLGRTGSREATGPLLAALGASEDVATRIAAVDALALIGASAARPALEALLEQTRSDTLKTHLVVALGAIRDGSTIPVLVGLLDSGSPEQRYLALTALTELGAAGSAEPIAAFYADLARDLDALRDHGYPQMAAALTAGLRMQAAALRALHELNPATGLDAFTHASRAQVFPRDSAAGLRLNVIAFESRRLAISGLGYAGSESAFERLVDDAIWGDPDPRIRAVAARAVAVTGNPNAARYVTGRLADPDPAVRWTAAASLGRLGSAEAVDPLRRSLDDAHSEVRRQAVLSLTLLDAFDARPKIERLSRQDPSERVRRAAANALELLSGLP